MRDPLARTELYGDIFERNFSIWLNLQTKPPHALRYGKEKKDHLWQIQRKEKIRKYFITEH